MTRNVHLITGPPGAGKSTHARTLGLRVYEREYYPSDQAFRATVRQACAAPDAQAAIIRCCPTLADLHEWRTLTQPTTVTTIATPRDTCASRIHKRARPRWRSEIAAVEHWWANRTDQTPNPLQRKGSRATRQPVEHADW